MNRLHRPAATTSCLRFVAVGLLVATAACRDEDALPPAIADYWDYHEEVGLRYCESSLGELDFTDEEFETQLKNCHFTALDIEDGFPRDPRRCYLQVLRESDEFHPLVTRIAECDTPLLAELDECLAGPADARTCYIAADQQRPQCLPPEFEDLVDAVRTCVANH